VVPIPAVPIGPGITAAGKTVSWLWTERERSAELQDIVRRSLRMSICRYNPCAPGVDVHVKLLEDQMWEHAKTAANHDTGPKPPIKQKLRQKLFRTSGSAKLHLPGWEEELQTWIEGAAGALGWNSLPDQRPDCLAFPSAAALGERFPHMFYQEVGATPSRNEHLLTALKEADALSSGSAHRDATAQWQAGLAAMVGIAIGLGIDEVVNLSAAAPEIASGAGGGLIGVAVLRIMKTVRVRLTSSQRALHEAARIWTLEFLMAQTDRRGGRSVHAMFHEWVQRESSQPTSCSAPADTGRIAELATLIRDGRACQERHFVRAASKLQSELERDYHSERARNALHGVIWRLWGPAAAP
jgi:hypothetical protein